MGTDGQDGNFEAQLAALCAAFEARLDDRLTELEDARADLAAADGAEGRGRAVEQVGRLAHGISGSAATFGYPELSKLAERLEAACSVDAGVEERLDRLIEAVRESRPAGAAGSA